MATSTDSTRTTMAAVARSCRWMTTLDCLRDPQPHRVQRLARTHVFQKKRKSSVFKTLNSRQKKRALGRSSFEEGFVKSKRRKSGGKNDDDDDDDEPAFVHVRGPGVRVLRTNGLVGTRVEKTTRRR